MLDRVDRITVSADRIRVTLRQIRGKGGSIEFPWTPKTKGNARVHPAESETRTDQKLLKSIARAHAWLADLSAGRLASIEDLAAAAHLHPKVVRQGLKLAFLAPDIVTSILAGNAQFALTDLRKISPELAKATRRTTSSRFLALAFPLPSPVKKFVLIFLLLIIGPVTLSTVNYLLGDRRGNWQTADRSSAGLLPKPSDHPDALIRVYAARTVRWRGIFAVHTWIVVKERGAPRYSRYDYTAWGDPIRIDGFAADGKWFGALPEAIVSVDGKKAEKLIPKIRSVVENYEFRAYGDYNPWPGPNSNTFTQAVLDSVPELRSVLPPTAIGKTIHTAVNGLVLTPSSTGVFVSLGGYLGLTVGWVEGVELNFFGGVLGLDIRRPALKFPGIGRLGMSLPVTEPIYCSQHVGRIGDSKAGQIRHDGVHDPI